MPKVTIEAPNGFRAYCSPAQVGEVTTKLAKHTQTDTAQWIAALGQVFEPFSQSIPQGTHKLLSAASSIVGFVDDTPLFVGDRLPLATSDLRRGAQAMRVCLLKEPGSKSRNEMLHTLKILDRLHLAAAELRHYSLGNLRELATKT